MPFDAAGYGPNYGNKALFIVPQVMVENISGLLLNEFLNAANLMFAYQKKIKVSEIHVAGSAEITTGHLDAYRNAICVLGDQPIIDTNGALCLSELRMEAVRAFHGRGDRAMLNFPGTVKRLLTEKRGFHAVTRWKISTFDLSEVDIGASQKLGAVALNKPLWSYVVDLNP